MKKAIYILLILLLVTCVGCNNVSTTGDDNTDEKYFSNESITNTESDTSNVEKENPVVPESIKGLIDIDEKPWGENKFFYRYKGDEFPIYFTADKDELSGKMKKDNWESDGSGIYVVDNTDKYFMYKGFLIGMINSPLLEAGFQLLGDSEKGFYSDDDTIKFFADGTYEYWPSEKICTQSGHYIMQDKHILKLLYIVDGEETIVYYFIDNDNKVYIAYPQNLNAYN